MKRRMLMLLCVLWLLPMVQAAEKTKVVFISGKPSHRPMSHEHRAGNTILADRLNKSGLDVEAIVLPEAGYPKDPSILEDADTIVIFCTGHAGHVVNPRLKEFDALMKKGIGVVMIHWATEAVKGEPGEKFLEWMGGFCDLNWSVNPHWTPSFKPVKHEIWNGVKAFTINDEWYYHMRFVEDSKGLTPILSGVPGPETLKRPDGPRSGNPHVRKAVANKEPQHVAWAYQREKGRGFGFTGGHKHMNWQDDSYRTIMLNAILWTAGRKVPEGGVPSATPSDEEMRAYIDSVPRKKAEVKPVPPPTPPSFQELRQQAIRPVDSRVSLELLSKTLAQSTDPRVQTALLEGILTGLDGQRDVEPPRNWSRTRMTLRRSSSDVVQELTTRLSQIFGDASAIQEALALLQDASMDLAARQRALGSLVGLKAEETREVLPGLLDQKDMRIDAIRAFGSLEDERAPKWILERYPAMEFQEKRAAVETLSSRKNYANALLDALKGGVVPKGDIPVYIARSLSQILGRQFTSVFGDIQELSQDKAAQIEKYRSLLMSDRMDRADVHQGRLLFQSVCASCHQLYGEGGEIGPDLTGSNRADIEYILLNMIDPSADVPDAYKAVTVTTRDGQVMVGTIAAEDDQRMVIKSVGQSHTVLKRDIRQRSRSELSMMPEGLLQALSNSQVLDLVKYLQTREQVELP